MSIISLVLCALIVAVMSVFLQWLHKQIKAWARGEIALRILRECGSVEALPNGCVPIAMKNLTGAADADIVRSLARPGIYAPERGSHICETARFFSENLGFKQIHGTTVDDWFKSLSDHEREGDYLVFTIIANPVCGVVGHATTLRNGVFCDMGDGDSLLSSVFVLALKLNKD